MVYGGNPFHAEGVAPEESEVGKLWGRFNGIWERHSRVFPHAVDARVAWELHVTTDAYEQTKRYVEMVGVEVASAADQPGPIFAQVLPAGQQAVFTLVGEQMNGDWNGAIYRDWLPGSGYEESVQVTLELYDEARFTGWGVPGSEIEARVPVRAKAEPTVGDGSAAGDPAVSALPSRWCGPPNLGLGGA